MRPVLGQEVPGVGWKGPCGRPCSSPGLTLLQTIFEINATSRTLASTVMRSKRRHDHALIEKYQRGQQEKRAAALKGQGLCPPCPGPEEGEEEEENLQVMGQERRRRWGGLPWELLQGGPRAVPGFRARAVTGGGTWLLHSPGSFQDVFSTVVGQKRKRDGGGEDGARKKPQQPAQQDKDFYIPYRPKDFESERG